MEVTDVASEHRELLVGDGVCMPSSAHHLQERGGEGRGLASAESTKLVVNRCTHRFLVVCQHCVEGGAELGVGGGL